ncbi:hypothetical protein [Haloarchaeobius sp. HRN-SO-5]|uniref:hypothetical protein n=1 Tax=Haloarchaeobius sp. HRN-SO-5 TaxID=3446118 RepID=UPI003EBD1899
MSRTRRETLSTCAVAVAGLSGCLSNFRSTPAAPRIKSVTAFNFDDKQHTLHLSVERQDGRTEYREVVEMEAGEPREPEGESVGTFPEDPPGTTLHSWTDSESSGAIADYDLTNGEGCVEVQINIGNFDRAENYVAIYSGNCL